MLTKIKTILKPFYKIRKRLKRNTIEELHRVLLEVLVGLLCLSERLEG